jgi:3-hydroxyisobutyrate dehydrogenase
VTRVGFVGIGRIGSLLAASVLREGFPLVVHDLDRRACEQLVGQGAQWAGSPREVAEATDVVITCLPSPAALTAVVSGPDGVLAGFPAGGTWIDMSTNDPQEARRLAALAAERGVVALEAPVTGGVHRAATGEITVLVGGDEAAFQTWEPVLRAMGGEVLHLGPVGTASTMKAGRRGGLRPRSDRKSKLSAGQHPVRRRLPSGAATSPGRHPKTSRR